MPELTRWNREGRQRKCTAQNNATAQEVCLPSRLHVRKLVVDSTGISFLQGHEMSLGSHTE
jgi:hypothetical protein